MAGGDRGGGGVWIYGRHAGLAAIANPARRIRRIVALAEAGEAAQAAIEASRRPGPPVEPIERAALAALLPADAVHQGIAVLAEPLPALGLEDVLFASGDDDAVFVVLDQATDPRNVGAVLRAAAAFRAAAVIVQDRHAPPVTGALAKAASGALERVPLVAVVNVARALRTLQAADTRIVGFAADAGSEPYHDLARTALPRRVALVFGAEGPGLRRLVREACDAVARIPIADGVDSLNLGTAAAIALYETARRRAAAAAAADGQGAAAPDGSRRCAG
jgi:23S rRNA (guanosine2251-2'-O)-methyltransferase